MIIQSFQKKYRNRIVLDFPGFTLAPGKIYAVVGSNGSGKSTLARILSGTIPTDNRQPAFAQENISVGYLPQKPYAFHMSVTKNLLLNSKNKDSIAEKKAAQLLETLNLSHLSAHLASHLSGGETARMALARLLMKSYSLIILDEPTAAFDMKNTYAAEGLIQNYSRKTGAAVLLITHSLNQAQRIAHEVLFLHQGKLLESGSAKNLFAAPSTPEFKEFLDFYRFS